MNLKKIVPFGRKDLPARREEHDPFSRLRQEMNRLFDGFDRGFLTEPFEGRFESFRPRVDVSETDKEIRIRRAHDQGGKEGRKGGQRQSLLPHGTFLRLLFADDPPSRGG
jgi:hypothetical protein